MWDQQGNLLWEDPLIVNGESAFEFATDTNKDGINEVIVYTHTKTMSNIKMYSGKEGTVIWKNDMKNLEFPNLRVVKDKLILSGIIDSTLKIIHFSLKTGTSVYETSVSNPSNNQFLSLVGTKDYIIALDDSNKVYSIIDTNEDNKIHSIYEVKNPENKKVSIIGSNSKNIFILQFALQTLILQVENSNINFVYSYSPGNRIVSKLGDSKELITILNEEQEIEIEILEYSKLPKDPMKTKLRVGTKVLGSFFSAENPSNYQLLIVTEDHTMQLIRDGSLLWSRDESLASIRYLNFVDFPLEKESIISSINIFGHEDSYLSRDKFGFKKLIIALTTFGKLVAMHTSNGNILWTSHYCNEVIDVFVTREASNVIPQLSLICQKKSLRSKEYETQIYSINALNGKEISKATFSSGNIIKSTLLPLKTTEGEQLLMLVDANHKIFIHPQHSQAKHIFGNSKNDIFYYLLNSTSNNLVGYSVSYDPEKEQFSLLSKPIWTVNFASNEEIVASFAGNFYEQIYSSVRLLADKTPLQKYINRNLLVVGTLKQFNSKTNEKDLNMYVIDTVSGNILYHTYHQYCNSPVNIVHSENWIIYSYWNSKAHRHEVSTLDMFHKELDTSSDQFSSFSESSVNIDVLQQTFVLPIGVNALGVTATSKGISSKQILFGLETEQIIALNRNLLDPRRPSKSQQQQTQTDPLEILVPYDPLLPMNPKYIITYYKKIARLQKIQTEAAYLESASLVIGYGLDVFFTRVSPSGTYDILNPDFNYPALIITSVTLLALTIASKYASRKSDLARAWK